MPSYGHRALAVLPAPNPELLAVAGASTLVLIASFYAVQYVVSRKAAAQSERQKSWILTLFSSALMTSLSLPYVGHWFRTGQLLHGGRAADYGCAFFIAYLVCDLVLGTLHYRSSISLLTGWVHHIAYILLLSLLIIPHNFGSLFSLCCVLELPTFLLAAGSLDKAYRNDYVFAVVFFLTRIVLHIQIGATYAWRAHSAGGSWVPTIVLACALPMHVLWMHGCVTGILRRRRLAAAARTAPQGVLPTWPAKHIQAVPAYLLSRPVVARALRRSRQHMLRLLHEALREDPAPPSSVSAESQSPSTVSAQAQAQSPVQTPAQTAGQGMSPYNAPRWRSIRRRVVGRIRRSLPDAYAVVPIAETESEPVPVAVAVVG